MTDPDRTNGLIVVDRAGRGGEQEDRRISVLIADDDPISRTLVEAMIATDDGLELVGSAEDAREAVELAERHRPDVAVLDWMMPAGGGPAAAQGIADVSPTTMITALTSSNTAEASFDMGRAGAAGFLVKGASAEEFVGSIRQLVRIRGMQAS
jgi:DNA-binding NarL/FixJ family response regulator